jgi:O-antigen ligase
MRLPAADPAPGEVRGTKVAGLAIAAGCVATGTALAAGLPALGLGIAATFLVIALVPDVERLGQLMVIGGFAAVAAVSDTVGGPAGVQGGDLEFSPLKWLAYGLLVGGTVALVLPSARPAMPLRRPHLLLGGYLLACGAGAALNPDPGLFLLRWAQVAVPFVALVAWWRRRGSSTALVVAVLAAAGWQVATALVSLARGQTYLSAEGAGGAVSEAGSRLGGLVHPVLLAFSAAAVAAWALWQVLTGRTRLVVAGLAILPLASLAIGFSKGRTGFLSGVAMVVAASVLSGRRSTGTSSRPVDPRKFLLLTGALLAVLFFSVIVGWFIRDNARELRTLTNRTRLWDATVELIAERPVVGWGPGLLRSGEVADRVEERVGFVGHTHNALLEASLGGGLLGGFLWLWAFMAAGRALVDRRSAADSFVAFLPCLWLGLFVWGIAEGNMAAFGLTWLLLLSLLGALPPRVGSAPGGSRPALVLAGR